MQKQWKNILLILFAVAYVTASQVTVFSILGTWYSTGGDAAVATHVGHSRDIGLPAWTPRTHLLVFQHPELSQALPASLYSYPAESTYDLISIERPPDHRCTFYSTGLCNKAPPQA